MTERPRRYQKRTTAEKAKAVGIAVLEGVTEAERQTGVTESSIRYWLDSPEFAHFRVRAREEIIGDVRAAFLKALQRTVELVSSSTDLRDVSDTADKLGNRLALLSGDATARTEHRDLDDADDREALDAAADAYLTARGVASGRVGDAAGARPAPDGDAGVHALPVPGVHPAGPLPS
jgi:hypothetical protein